MDNEKQWNLELISLMKEEIQKNHANLILGSKPILRDIYFQKDKNKLPYIQLGLFDQDIVIYDESESIDTMDWAKINGIRTHNNDKLSKKIIVPKVIFELKFNGVNTHTLITYSNIAYDIKSIFPFCKYFLLLYYRAGSSNNKFLRNGKSFDHIVFFNDGVAPKKEYKEGQFSEYLKSDQNATSKFKNVIDLTNHYLTMESDLAVK